MKKLMFALAAVACGTLLAADGSIQSANIVGYQTLEVESTGFTFTVPTFESITGAIDIQDIQLIITGDATGADNIQILGSAGETLETYNWFPKDWMYPVPENDGWVDGTTGGLAEKEIKAGQGFLVDIADATTKIVLPQAIK